MQGFSVLEVLIAVTVVGIVCIPFAGFLAGVPGWLDELADRSQAQFLAEKRLLMLFEKEFSSVQTGPREQIPGRKGLEWEVVVSEEHARWKAVAVNIYRCCGGEPVHLFGLKTIISR